MRLRRSDSDINAKRDSVLNSGNGQTRIAFDDRLFRQDSRDFWITHPANLVNPVSKPALFDRPAGLSDSGLVERRRWRVEADSAARSIARARQVSLRLDLPCAARPQIRPSLSGIP